MKITFISQILQRLQSESPAFFKKLQNIGLFLAAIASIVIGLKEYEVFEIPQGIENLCFYILTFAGGITVTAKTATTNAELIDTKTKVNVIQESLGSEEKDIESIIPKP